MTNTTDNTNKTNGKLSTFRLLIKNTGIHMGFVVVDVESERCYINNGDAAAFSPVASFAFASVNEAICRALDPETRKRVSVPLRTVGIGTDFDVASF